MAEPSFYNRSNLAGPTTGNPAPQVSNDLGGIFLDFTPKQFMATLLIWGAIGTVCTLTWIGAYDVGCYLAKTIHPAWWANGI